MSGLYFLAVLFIWLAVVVVLTRWLMRQIRIKSELIRIVLAPTLFVVTLALPVTDEIVGGFQFRALCRENAVLRIDAEKAKGRTIKETINPSNEILPRTAITIYHSRTSYWDISTKKEIASSDRYVAKGGWFIRMLGVSETNDPLIIEPSYCPPSLGAYVIAKQYGFTFIE